jgi:hypothetical protein
MKAWLLTDQTYTPKSVDSIINKLTVEYDPELDKAIVKGDIDLRYLTSAEGLQLPKNIGGHLDLEHLKNTKDLILPENISGDLSLPKLYDFDEGFTLPRNVGGSLDLEELSSAEGLVFPESVGRNLNIQMLENTEGLVLPKTVGRLIVNFSEEVKNNIKQERPDLADKLKDYYEEDDF